MRLISFCFVSSVVVAQVVQNACLSTVNPCYDKSTCKLSTYVIGTAVCQCPTGLQGDGVGPNGCTDIDECATGKHACSTKQVCSNTFGSYECICDSGYRFNANLRTTDKCEDINECATPNICGRDPTISSCTNYPGSYECVCNDNRYVWNGASCVDKDECTYKAGRDNACHQKCINTQPGYECACFAGYKLASDGFACEDIDECTAGSHNCNSKCTNTVGSFTCECSVANGEVANDVTGECENYNECMYVTDICTADECCHDLLPSEGKYKCTPRADKKQRRLQLSSNLLYAASASNSNLSDSGRCEKGGKTAAEWATEKSKVKLASTTSTLTSGVTEDGKSSFWTYFLQGQLDPNVAAAFSNYNLFGSIPVQNISSPLFSYPMTLLNNLATVFAGGQGVGTWFNYLGGSASSSNGGTGTTRRLNEKEESNKKHLRD